MSKPLRLTINGFGRIGRTVLRQALQQEGVEVAAINDIAPAETCAYLFAYDSVFGPSAESVTAQDGVLRIGAGEIPLSHTPNISELDLSDIDVVLECTGKAATRSFAEAGLRAGAARVLISGPCDVADATVVLGANETAAEGCRVVSNASCTTNALAPLLRVLDEAFGVESGHMTTVHCYTGSQPTVDAPRGQPLERNRAAALSMVPTSTSAGHLVGAVLPHLAGRIAARAVRVPAASVSAIDLMVTLAGRPDQGALAAALREAVGPVIGWTDAPLVSADLRGRPESLILAGPELLVTGGLARIFGWYDNEWGFSARMLDMARRIRPL